MFHLFLNIVRKENDQPSKWFELLSNSSINTSIAYYIKNVFPIKKIILLDQI